MSDGIDPRVGEAFVREIFGLDPRSVVLASRSPRRRELLARLGFIAEVVPADVDELPLPQEQPVAHVLRIAESKARAVLGRFPGRLVVAADTIVTLRGRLLGKPVDEDEARAMLRELSGRSHTVVTGVAVARDAALSVGSESTRVTFRTLEEREISAYVASGEPADKAGAYGAQALGAAFISSFDGCYYNVVGLPIVRLLELVRETLRTHASSRGE